MRTTTSYSDLRKNLAATLDRVAEDHEPVVITRERANRRLCRSRSKISLLTKKPAISCRVRAMPSACAQPSMNSTRGAATVATIIDAHPRASAIITAPASMTAAPKSRPPDSSFSTCLLARTVKSAESRLMAMT